MSENKLKLNQKLSCIQARMHAKKSRYNGFGKYNYRSAEDILEAIKPFLIEFNVTVRITESIDKVGDLYMLESEAIISDGWETITGVALVAVDLDQKGMNMPQKFGSASSYAKKYSLGNLFLIDDTADPDATNQHGGKKVSKILISSEASDAYIKAKAYIQDGGSVAAIESKYELSAAIKKSLKSIKPTKK